MSSEKRRMNSEQWDMVKLGDVATYINGYPFKPTEWSQIGLPIIRIQNLTGNSYETNYFEGEINNKYVINNGDILISWSASLGVYEWNSGKALLNQHIFKVEFDKIIVDKKYFIYAVQKVLLQSLNQTHGSTMKHITKSRFDNLEIPLPPLDVQKQIADELDKITGLIEKRKQQIEKLDLLVKAKFVEMFGEVEYEEKELLQVSKKITDGTHQSPKFVKEGIPFLLISNIINYEVNYNTSKFISEEEYEKLIKRTPIEKGDVLITTVGSYGNPAIIKSDRKFCFQRHIGYIKPDKNVVNSCFLKYFFLSPYGKEQIEFRVKGIAQKTLNLSELKTIRVPLPSLHIQTQFANYVEKVEQTKASFQKSLEQLEILYKQRMQEYFG